MSILFLVESPHKAETLKHILSKEYVIMASVGHVMDLDPHGMSIDIENNFTPNYIINKDKVDVVSKIKVAAKKASKIIFAADPDREGEMIAWSLAKILGIKNPQRVTYTEITKDAILKSLEKPRDIDLALVDAQKTRRILDRIVGYEISPLLMKILSVMHLSAGRVQSVVTKLIVDKENEINNYFSKEMPAIFKFNGEFKNNKDILKAILFNLNDSTEKISKKKIKNGNEKKEVEKIDEELENPAEKGIVKIQSLNEAKELMNLFRKSKFTVNKIDENILFRNPSSPFSTASMQQASANKIGFSVKRTMTAAQNLYEAGYITYLRTDSINLSDEAINNIGKFIIKKYGTKYYRKMQYKSKSKNTQEAHEAIRPTDINIVDNLTGKKIGNDELRLYTLIWKRTIASQMTPAQIKQIKLHINISNLNKYEFISHSEIVEFQGFLKVYNIENVEKETEDVQTIKDIPKIGTILTINEIIGKQTHQKPPSRYNDGSLVNKMKPENLNIGRPATTQSIITIIQDRKYVEKKDVEGVEKDIIVMKLGSDNKVNIENEKIMLGKENNKFVPTELGIIVNGFLIKYFPKIMDYNFTSSMEDKLDEIAEGKINWIKVMKDFYKNFHPIVEKIKVEAKELIKKNSRSLGKHPKTGEEILVALAKFGPVIKMKQNKKFIYAPIQKPLTMETITLKDAIKLFEYPKILGKYNDIEIYLQKGKFGFYLKYGKENISVGEKSDITFDDAKKLIDEKEAKNLWKAVDGNKIYKILEGQYGKYINVSGVTKKSINYKLPKDIDVKNITIEQVKEIVSKPKPRRFFKKTK
jgi:DNA topoisomerase-1